MMKRGSDGLSGVSTNYSQVRQVPDDYDMYLVPNGWVMIRS